MQRDDRFWLTKEQQDEFERERMDHVLTTRRRLCGLPEEYLKGELSLVTYPAKTPQHAAAVRACMDWVARIAPKKSLFISGAVGVGKTHLAQASIGAMLAKGSARFTTRVDLVAEIAAVFSDDTLSEHAAVQRLVDVNFLAIDDIDKGRVTEFVLKTLYTIVDSRWKHGRPTIFTCNRTVAQLYDFLCTGGDDVTAHAIVDRVQAMSVVIDLPGQSFRATRAS